MGHRRYLRALLLLGAASLCALIALRSPEPRRERATTTRPPAAPAQPPVADAPRPPAPSAPAPAIHLERPKEAPRPRPIEDLLSLFRSSGPDGPDDADVRELLRHACEHGERQRLAAAEALLSLGSRRAAGVAWRLADSVLGTDVRTISDDDAYALVGQRAASILLAGGSDERVAADAGRILARVGSPRAIDTFLLLADTGRPGAGWLSGVDNPASVPRLAQALASPGRRGAWFVACALCNSGEGRAELRRFLDPGIDWVVHADAKVAALAALAGRFRDAADLDAIERAVEHRPEALPAAVAAFTRTSPPEKAADGVLAAWCSERRSAIRAFLANHTGPAIEGAVLAILPPNPDPTLPTARR